MGLFFSKDDKEDEAAEKYKVTIDPLAALQKPITFGKPEYSQCAESAFVVRQTGWFGQSRLKNLKAEDAEIRDAHGSPIYQIERNKQKIPSGKIKGTALYIRDAHGTHIASVIRVFDSTGICLNWRIVDENNILLAVVRTRPTWTADIERFDFYVYRQPSLPFDTDFDCENPSGIAFADVFLLSLQGRFDHPKANYDCYFVNAPQNEQLGEMSRASDNIVAHVSQDEEEFDFAGAKKDNRIQYVTRVAPGMSSLLAACMNIVVDQTVAEQDNLSSAFQWNDC